MPVNVTVGMAKKSPALLVKYAKYNAALANIEAIKAKNEFNIGFEARALWPFAGSGRDSDESLGFVAKKTFLMAECSNRKLSKQKRWLTRC